MDLIKELQQINEAKIDLDKDQMLDILHHAHIMMKEDPGLDLEEAIGAQLEDVPGLEGKDHIKIIRAIANMKL